MISYRLVSLQTSRTNTKRVINTFKFGYPRLTLEKGPKIKSDNTSRFLHFKLLGPIISEFQALYVWLSLFDLEGGAQSENSHPMISSKLVSHWKNLGPITNEL